MEMEDCDSPRRDPIQDWIIQVEEKCRTITSNKGGGAAQEWKNAEPSPPTKEEELPKSNERRCIYEVPDNIKREGDFKDVYRPCWVSFGPFYEYGFYGSIIHSSTALRDKEAALIHFLRRSGKPLQLYYEAVAAVVEELKDNYDQPVSYRNDYFSKLMVIDGCFLIEILRGVTDPQSYDASGNPLLSIHEDPILMDHYRHDMLLLRNQLPTLLLEVLLNVETEGNYYNQREILEDGIVKMFSLPQKSVRYANKEYKHILEAYRNVLVDQFVFSGGKDYKYPRSRETRSTGFHVFSIPSATELLKVGIGFTISKTTSLKDISFQRKTLSLPHIVVDGTTKSRFLNIIAFEQVHAGAGNEVTSYIYFMRSLIQDATDVCHLQSIGVINTALPNAEVAQLFHRLSKDILLDPNKSMAYEYSEAGRMLRERFNKMSTEWRKDLFQTYLRSPWAIVSVTAAVLLFTLTIIQTIYTVLSYVNRK